MSTLGGQGHLYLYYWLYHLFQSPHSCRLFEANSRIPELFLGIRLLNILAERCHINHTSFLFFLYTYTHKLTQRIYALEYFSWYSD